MEGNENVGGHGIPSLETRDWRFKKNVQIDGLLHRSPARVYYEEFFERLPSVNGSLAHTVNQNFEVLGSGGSADDVTFSTVTAGLKIETDGGGTNSVIILPHLASNQTSWTGTKWGTENQVTWECAIRTGSAITAQVIWAGLKLTNTATIATDDDQVFFRYSTTDSDTTWKVESSIGGSDTATDSGVSVAVDTNYTFRIEIDSARRAHCYINDKRVYTTAALTNDVDLIPYVGLLEQAAAAKHMYLFYEKIGRKLFE